MRRLPTRPPTAPLAGLLVVAALTAAPARAQIPQGQPASEPKPAAPAPAPSPSKPQAPPSTPLIDPGVEKVIGELEHPGSAHRPASPSGGAVRRLGPANLDRGHARLLPEGTFLPSRRGHITARAGQTLFVFDADDQGHAEPPMALLPNQFLATLDRMVRDRPPETEFTVSGQVFAYHDRNYLLLSTPPLVSSTPAAGSGATTGAPPVNRHAGASGTDMDQARDGRGPRRTPMPEGSFLAARRGRLVRSAGGEWMLVFDTGLQDTADGPMGLMPCAALGNMERLAEQQGEAASFTVSGQVFLYHDRNYVLPAIYQLNHRNGDVIPTQ
jgi:hypothetical protein